MKKTAATVISVIVILGLLAASLSLSSFSLSKEACATFKILLIVCLCSIAYCFIVGETARNFSQMDKLWSLLPIAYLWIIAARGEMKARLVIFALIVTAWGVRLTINFARKGAYRLKFWTGEEDYRWAIVRESRFLKNKFAWAAFDLLFICAYQNLLVLAICLPALAIMDCAAPLSIWDAIAAAAAVGFLILETVSDEYQWRFHQKKKAMLAGGTPPERLEKPYDLGFNTLGPWSYMRHPNYLGEQGIWLSLYFFTVGAGVTNHFLFHWSFAGALLLVLLFIGSSSLGESISSKKYPKYEDYKRKVFKYLPLRKYTE